MKLIVLHNISGHNKYKGNWCKIRVRTLKDWILNETFLYMSVDLIFGFNIVNISFIHSKHINQLVEIQCNSCIK